MKADKLNYALVHPVYPVFTPHSISTTTSPDEHGAPSRLAKGDNSSSTPSPPPLDDHTGGQKLGLNLLTCQPVDGHFFFFCCCQHSWSRLHCIGLQLRSN